MCYPKIEIQITMFFSCHIWKILVLIFSNFGFKSKSKILWWVLVHMRAKCCSHKGIQKHEINISVFMIKIRQKIFYIISENQKMKKFYKSNNDTLKRHLDFTIFSLDLTTSKVWRCYNDWFIVDDLIKVICF